MPNNHLASLPFEQQIGQFFFIGLPGTEIDEETRKLIEEIKPGGLIIFGRNVESPEQLRKLLDDGRSLVPTNPFCAIDQEGGLVDRLREIFPPMPSARAIRQHGDLAGARRLGRVSGELLRMLGFDLNFAPVMSIITEARSKLTNGLYSRSFGRSPGEVLGYTTVYMRGLQGYGLTRLFETLPGDRRRRSRFAHRDAPRAAYPRRFDVSGSRAVHRTLPACRRSCARGDGQPRRLSEHRHQERHDPRPRSSGFDQFQHRDASCCVRNSDTDTWSSLMTWKWARLRSSMKLRMPRLRHSPRERTCC